MNLIQELLNILDRKEDKKSLDLKRDYFEFGRSNPSSVGNPLYSPKMTPHAIRFDNLVEAIEENLSLNDYTLLDTNDIDYISNIQLVNTNLQIQGVGNAFSGAIDLSGLAGTTYTANNGIQLVTLTEFGLVDVTRTNSSNAIAPNHTDSFTVIDDITTNSKGQVTNVNLKTVTLPASGTGADGVITNIALSGTDLVFTGSNGGFNGTVSLSTLGPDGNATYTLGLVANGANDTVVKLTGANGGASSQFTLAGGTGISITENTSTNTIVIENTVVDTNDIDFVRTVALNGTNLDFTGVGNAFTGSIDLSSLSGTNYTAGTYLTLSGTSFNHNATTRSNTTSVLSPPVGGTFTVVDSVVTNATGHITEVNTKTVTLPFLSTVACVGGITIRHIQSLTSTKVPIQNRSIKLGFISNAPSTRHYNIVWTIEYATTGIIGFKQLLTSVRVTPNGGTPAIVIDWKDSAYMLNDKEFGSTSTYSYTLSNFNPGDSVEILVGGSSDVQVVQANLSATIVACEGFGANEVRTIEAESLAGDPIDDTSDNGGTTYNYYNVLNCNSDVAGIMAVSTSIAQPDIDGAVYSYVLDNESLVNTPWATEMLVRVVTIADPQTEDFTVLALTRDACLLT